jgi:hypothetical protein
MRPVAAVALAFMVLFQLWSTLSYGIDLLWTLSVYLGLYQPIPMSMPEEAALFMAVDNGVVLSIELLVHVVLRGLALLFLGVALPAVVSRRRAVATGATVFATLAHLADHAVAFVASLVFPNYAEMDVFMMRWEPWLGELAYTLLELAFLGDLAQAAVAAVFGLVLTLLAFLGAAPAPSD